MPGVVNWTVTVDVCPVSKVDGVSVIAVSFAMLAVTVSGELNWPMVAPVDEPVAMAKVALVAFVSAFVTWLMENETVVPAFTVLPVPRYSFRVVPEVTSHCVSDSSPEKRLVHDEVAFARSVMEIVDGKVIVMIPAAVMVSMGTNEKRNVAEETVL